MYKLLAMAVVLTFGASVLCAGEGNDLAAQRREAVKARNDGNVKDAYEIFEKLCLNPADGKTEVGGDLDAAIQCLRNLDRESEVDALREKTIEVHKDNWWLLKYAANSFGSCSNHGYIVAGKFERGNHRGGGKIVNCFERDRVRELQLLEQAVKAIAADKDATAGNKANLYFEYASRLANGRGYDQSWRMQYLTDLSTLPDYEDGWYNWYNYRSASSGAPVDAAGNPVFHQLPESWEKAASDGERWRWLLLQAMELGPDYKNAAQGALAQFAYNQFGVQTMQYYGRWFYGGADEQGETERQAGIFSLQTLGDDETIARLAAGVKRFKLPADYNYIKIWREQNNHRQLAEIFANRRQYDKAAEQWRLYAERNKGNQNAEKEAKENLAQILDPWGAFEPTMSKPAGEGAKVGYRFRNGDKVSFTARKIKVRELLDAIKGYIKENRRDEDWQLSDPRNIGYRLVTKNQEQFLGDQAAAWELPLQPRDNHFDRRVTVSTPLQQAGAYLLEAKMENGNTSRVIVWISDTALVKKPLDGKQLLFVADAVTGQPLAKANVEFFGYNRNWRNNHYDTDVRNFAEFTDEDGRIFLDEASAPHNYQWLLVATKDGRLDYLGFTGLWYGQHHDEEYNEWKAYVITDRPVYRPQQKVKFKFWVGAAKYDQGDASEFANREYSVGIVNPKGEKLFEKIYKTDEYGGIEGEAELAADAQLGVYGIGFWSGKNLDTRGSFRVEEYKKPEFEVKVEAPSEPVALGEKIKVKVAAKYYFGSPVAEAKVKYKVERFAHDDRWYPVMPWDWFYGSGYWWFACDYDWYPGWRAWGCLRPVWWWYGSRQEPPELVAAGEAKLAADGTYEIEIDTALAKEMHGDSDHRYEVTAEVTDQSRRVIVGQGRTLVARKPFKVYAWLDRGYYDAGDTVHACFDAHTPDNKPVAGKGTLKLFKLAYKDGAPVETEVEKWELDPNAEGRAERQLKAGQAGQYRLSYTVADAQDHAIEGGYVFTVRGEKTAAADFRFNDIEITTDKREYVPGEKVKLLVNVNRAGGTVLLFVRPANGVYLPPEIFRLEGKSLVKEIEVAKRDMPNFFVEALTVSGGKVHVETREIAVPPEQRVLNVEVEPSATEYKPGEQAKLKVKVTDFAGKPFKGSTVISVYDKAVEYISGGSNVGDIKEFFWKWRRHHTPRTEENLTRWFGQLFKENETGMYNLGIFGDTVAETAGDDDDDEGSAIDEVYDMGGRVGAGRRAIVMNKCVALSEAGAADGMAMPSAAAEAPMNALGDMDKAAKDKSEAQQGAPGAEQGGAAAPELAQTTVRSNFADTAYWNGLLNTADDGTATVEFAMPENLTAWKIKCWGMGSGTRVGEGSAEAVTRKNLILRLQAPRFFVQKDEVVLSANVHNYLKDRKTAKVSLELDGATLALLDAAQAEQSVEIEPGGEKRVDWRVAVKEEGEAVVRMKALTDEESDAMEMRFPARVHGLDKMVPQCGVIRPEADSAVVTLEVPAERRVNASRLEVRYSPSLAGAMVDALPYLADYPYGCTEQTLNRFLPTAITQATLKRMGVSLKDIRDKRANLNAQELGDGKERAAQWKRYDREPVFDEAEVEKMVKAGVERLTAMQVGDGGWGWFSGWGECSYPHTTAVVVHGLQTAQKNGVALVPGVLERGVQWLKNYEAGEVAEIKLFAATKGIKGKEHADDLDALVYMTLADADSLNGEMREFLYRDRNGLSVYAKAMFGLALQKQGQREKLDMILKNIEQYLVMDKENQTAYLKLGNDAYWWCWYGSEIEAHAYYLKLLAATDPKGEKAVWLVKYLLNNRKHSSYWNSTRDTALAVESFADYIAASGEDKPDLTLEVLLDGRKLKEVKIDKDNLFSFDNGVVVLGDAVETGTHRLELRKKGLGPLYFNAYLSYFTLEDYIPKAGLEVKVQRKFYKLIREEAAVKAAGARGQALEQKAEKFRREPLADLATLKSGDLVEVELEIESKNDYEYILFEDRKAAGFEAVDVRSGYVPNDLNAYVEFRDEKVCFFVRQLARGNHSVSYRLRAEIPGKFSALPATASAMYAPELRGNSDEIKLNVED